MKVLSLFDGMSCGQIALQKAGIPVNAYFSSEIDKFAMKVAGDNFPFMRAMGDVTNVRAELLPGIDLLIGGSPCQGFSFAGKQLNFEDPRSKLFFEYVRLKKALKPEFFLLENVIMKKECVDIISEYLGVEPIMINSALVSAQNRKRLYWTNIKVQQPEDKKIFLKDVIEDGSIIQRGRGFNKGNIFTEKSPTLTSHYWEQNNHVLVHNIYGGFKENHCRVFEGKSPTLRANSGGGAMPSVFHGTKEQALAMPLPELRKHIRKLTVTECKRLQTVPDDYLMNVSDTQAYKMLGNGWTVDVIAHIFKGIK